MAVTRMVFAATATAALATLLSGCGREPSAEAPLRSNLASFEAEAERVLALLPYRGVNGCHAPGAQLSMGDVGDVDAVCVGGPDEGGQFVEFRHFSQRSDGYEGVEGVVRASADAPPAVNGGCVRRLFGRWWQLKRAHDLLRCPHGFLGVGYG